MLSSLTRMGIFAALISGACAMQIRQRSPEDEAKIAELTQKVQDYREAEVCPPEQLRKLEEEVLDHLNDSIIKQFRIQYLLKDELNVSPNRIKDCLANAYLKCLMVSQTAADHEAYRWRLIHQLGLSSEAIERGLRELPETHRRRLNETALNETALLRAN